eukprot:Gb_19266 [translate_table: standard]
MATTLKAMQEENDMIGMLRNSIPVRKRGREAEIGAGAGMDKRWPGWPGESVFRVLVPVQKVGSIIGRKGEFVKKMCEETRSRIKILAGIPGAPERTVGHRPLHRDSTRSVCSCASKIAILFFLNWISYLS